MVEHELPKLIARVRFPSSALERRPRSKTWAFVVVQASRPLPCPPRAPTRGNLLTRGSSHPTCTVQKGAVGRRGWLRPSTGVPSPLSPPARDRPPRPPWSPASCGSLRGAPRTHPAGSRPDGLRVAADGRPCSRNAAPGGNQYLSPRSESLTNPTGRVFPHRTRWRYLTHTSRCSMLLSISVAVLVPKNFKCSSRPPRHIRVLHISGSFSGGASSRRHGVRTVRMPVYCPKGDMTWHLAP